MLLSALTYAHSPTHLNNTPHTSHRYGNSAAFGSRVRDAPLDELEAQLELQVKASPSTADKGTLAQTKEGTDSTGSAEGEGEGDMKVNKSRSASASADTLGQDKDRPRIFHGHTMGPASLAFWHQVSLSGTLDCLEYLDLGAILYTVGDLLHVERCIRQL